ncbi:MAG: transcription termination factor NusA [Patescibacteria group bacterium]|nr:transcription termination factor NusA [Patescibacteria group bacterium]
MDKQPFTSAISQICEEKGISKEKVMETVEMALAAAYKKEYGRKNQNIRVDFDLEKNKMKVFQIKLVVDESMLKTEESEEEETEQKETGEEEIEKKIRFNPERHILIEEIKGLSLDEKPIFKGKKLTEAKKEKIKANDEIEFPLKVMGDFGRIAAQTAKQVIIQRIREAEREAVYEEYKDKEGEIASGIVQRIENNNVFLDIGKATGVLFPEEQIPREYYKIGQRLRVYIVEAHKDSRGPTVALSRAHPEMVSKLFALEVPEIASGTVTIKSIAREAGSRSKIAVASTEERVDPIGSMIGQKGTRVQAVINELSGEKIDIIEWSKDPVKFISNALSPAKVVDIKIDKENGQARVIVPEDQLSLAIGIKGQNVRLAAKLTGWKIDIIALEKEKEQKKEGKEKKPTKGGSPPKNGQAASGEKKPAKKKKKIVDKKGLKKEKAEKNQGTKKIKKKEKKKIKKKKLKEKTSKKKECSETKKTKKKK